MVKATTKVEDNKAVTEDREKVKWQGVVSLLRSNGQFFQITRPDKSEEWIRKEAIFSFRVMGNSVYLKVFGQSFDQVISFNSRWEALKLAEDIATAFAKEQS